jgi:cytochrome c553
MRWPRLLVALSISATLLGCSGAETPEERAVELYGYCEQCHGTRGEGNYEFRVPAIAGLPQWYVQAQLDKFRIGARGDHPEDVDGLRMRPMSRTLATPREVELVSAYVASLPRVDPVPRLPAGDPERGRALFQTCIQCHQEDASGSQEKNAPPLTLHSDWYIVAQLEKFRTGIRGTDPLDATGSQMRAMSMTLANEEAMRDVAAYIASIEPTQE